MRVLSRALAYTYWSTFACFRFCKYVHYSSFIELLEEECHFLIIHYLPTLQYMRRELTVVKSTYIMYMQSKTERTNIYKQTRSILSA
jgi:hypothetical protein